jgi:hypothetical protein
MPTNTYVALDTQTLGTATNTVTFSSISQAYTDLRIVVNNAKATITQRNVFIRVGNGSVDTGSNYSYTNVGARSFSGTPFSARQSNQTSGKLSDYTAMTTSQAQMSLVDIMNYSNTTTFKTTLVSTRVQPGDATYSGVEDLVILWRSTSAINVISIFTDVADTFQAGTTFSLYGIKAESVLSPTAKATGGTITTDQFGYVYHTFTSSGTFTPSQALTCDAMVLAGGGGGGQMSGGGGGAGGLLGLTSQSFAATGYSVTIGGGGAGSSTTSRGTSGVDSSIAGFTSAVGGGGGGSQGGTATGATGGSGGGGTYVGQAGGAATIPQGFAGGAGSGDAGAGGGGGGAGAVGINGQTGSPYASGNGGAGSSAYASWALITSTGVSGLYAGGGGGGNNSGANTPGTGGTGGGGNGRRDNLAGSAGTTNTGSGGGGGGDSTAGYSGGSGIVIIRYYGA